MSDKVMVWEVTVDCGDLIFYQHLETEGEVALYLNDYKETKCKLSTRLVELPLDVWKEIFESNEKRKRRD